MLTLWIGFAVGIVPTISMIFTSLAAWKVSNISSILEANAQNFCAGLIVGAVAKELFPELGDFNDFETMIGISLGFLIGCFFFHGLDTIVELFEEYQRHLEIVEKKNQSHRHLSKEELQPFLHSRSSNAIVATSSSRKPLDPLSPQYYQTMDDCQPNKVVITGLAPPLVDSLAANDEPRLAASPEDASDREYMGTSTKLENDEGTGGSEEESNSGTSDSDQKSILLLAKQAMSSPGQRHHLIDELLHMIEILDLLQVQSNELLSKNVIRNNRIAVINNYQNNNNPSSMGSTPTRKRGATLTTTTAEIECLAEKIDEEAHQLQYVIDHCRRMIHGSGAGFESVLPRVMITEEGIERLNNQLMKMKDLASNIHATLSETTAEDLQHYNQNHSSGKDNKNQCPPNSMTPQRETLPLPKGKQHLQDKPDTPPGLKIKNLQNTIRDKEDCSNALASCPLHYPNLSRHQLKQLYYFLAEMDKELNNLHNAVEGYTYQWGNRSKSSQVPIPEIGSTIPISFLMPVTVDCIVDGFLLGITASISTHAGWILSFANAIEMGFLGLAVSIRIQKCTGSSMIARLSSLVIPPLIMCLSAVLSAMAGYSIKSHLIFYNMFISFGIVALMSLVINELLVEARNISQSYAGKLPWWSGMMFFFGIYMVILMDMLLPANTSS